MLTLSPVSEIIPGISVADIDSEELRDRTLKKIEEENEKYRISLHPSADTPYAHEVFNNTEYLRQLIESFKGQIVLDLGAGSRAHGYVYANLAKALAYVGVEPYNFLEVEKRLTDHKSLDGDDELEGRVAKRSEAPIPRAVIKEDMLSALKRLPPDSISVFAAGIDKYIIPHNEYATKVEDEIARVLHPAGAYIGYWSMFFPRLKLKTENPEELEDRSAYFFLRFSK